MESNEQTAGGVRAPLPGRGSERPRISPFDSSSAARFQRLRIRLSTHPLPLVPIDFRFAFRLILCRSVLVTIRPLPDPAAIGAKVPTSGGRPQPCSMARAGPTELLMSSSADNVTTVFVVHRLRVRGGPCVRYTSGGGTCFHQSNMASASS